MGWLNGPGVARYFLTATELGTDLSRFDDNFRGISSSEIPGSFDFLCLDLSFDAFVDLKARSSDFTEDWLLVLLFDVDMDLERPASLWPFPCWRRFFELKRRFWLGDRTFKHLFRVHDKRSETRPEEEALLWPGAGSVSSDDSASDELIVLHRLSSSSESKYWIGFACCWRRSKRLRVWRVGMLKARLNKSTSSLSLCRCPNPRPMAHLTNKPTSI